MLTVYPPDVGKKQEADTVTAICKVCNEKYSNIVPYSTAWEENPSQNKEDKIIKQGQLTQIKDTPAAVNDRVVPGAMDTTSNQGKQNKKGIYDSQTSLPSEGYEQEGISLRLDDNPNSIVGPKYNIPFSPTYLTTSFNPVDDGGNTTSMDGAGNNMYFSLMDGGGNTSPTDSAIDSSGPTESDDIITMDGAGDDISSSPTGVATTHSDPGYNCRIDLNPVPSIDQNQAHHSDLRLTPEDEKFISKVPTINHQSQIE